MRELHVPVLLHEVIESLNPNPNQNYIDATLGFGGHSEEILRKISPNGCLLGIDKDQDAIDSAKERLKEYGKRFLTRKGNFDQLISLADGFVVSGGILADIGVSSVQLDNPSRGFSFNKTGPLDMRMDRSQELTAKKLVNEWGESEIGRLLRDFGEEKFAKKIAKSIVRARAIKHIETTVELAEIISTSIPRRFWPKGIHPATRSFQGIRIAVNDELGNLERFLSDACEILGPGARLAVITFHSLEDRIVKDYFNKRANPCTCPPEFPKCVCGKVGDVRILTKKPITASKEEVALNPRSRSAKLRVVEKI